MYREVSTRVQFAKIEENILSFWKQQNIFKKSLEKNRGKEEFVFYDGPPFATGLPHFGHFVPSTVKDIIPRYHTMKGKHVLRRFGWDCHGLPVEYEVEKEMGLSGKTDIEKFGIAQFNERCRNIVLRYTSEWREVIERLGRWVDFDNDYKTMDLPYMESIWWVFKTLWDKGYIYKGFYILPYSPLLATPLSNFEVNLGGYQQVYDPSVTVRFKVQNAHNEFFLAWTTTPWTLPSNQGLAVGDEIKYVKVQDKDAIYILAEERLSYYYKDASEYSIVQRYQGKDLVGLSYEPLFPYFSDLASQGGFVVHSADFVSTDEGTGIVHMAGGFGEDDYAIVCKKAGLPVVCPIDAECKFTNEVPDYEGMFVKDADKPIIQRLKEEGNLVKREQYLHNYPFCYRTKKPLIYRAVSSWFVDIAKIKRKMIQANNTITWQPSHLKQGRFGKWLDNAQEWAISRNRYWGNPLPVWMNEDESCIEVIGSVKDLEMKSGQKIDDLHKHKIDEITWEAPNGKGTMRRTPEVLDCWFESGAMPYAQNHYPFENKEFFENNYPADFISEGLDQTRGWFYTLTVLSAALFDVPAFNNVIVSGLVLAEDGKKMSKSERNFTDPVEVIHTFGADALRLFLMNSSVLKAEDLKYSDEQLKEETKRFLLPLWSAYSFFVTYANIDGVRPSTLDDFVAKNPLDQWILSELSLLIETVDRCLDQYTILVALKALYNFLDILNNWYIRRSRRRFWRSINDYDKIEGYECLYRVLINFVMLTAPIVPFISEEIYQNLKIEGMPESVHLCDFPTPIYARDVDLEQRMSSVQKAVFLGRGIRSMYQLKNRQPLATLYIVTRNMEERIALQEMEDILKEELNVKTVVFRQNEEDLVSYQVKANFKVLGKVLGKNMKQAAQMIASLNSNQIQSLLEGTTLTIEVNGQEVELHKDNVIVDRLEKDNLKVLNEGSMTVALDPTLTLELQQEGIVRDIIRLIQIQRREQNFTITDRIKLEVTLNDDMYMSALESFKSYVMEETLAEHIVISRNKTSDSFVSTMYDVNSVSIEIGMKKIHEA